MTTVAREKISKGNCIYEHGMADKSRDILGRQ